MSDNKNFGYLGQSFQLKLINQLISDEKYSESIIDSVKPEFFDDKYFRVITQLIKEHYKKYNSIPNFDTLVNIIKTEIGSELEQKIIFDTIKSIKEVDFKDIEFVKDKAEKFVKQQILKKALNDIGKIIEKGEFENYDKCQSILNKALEVGNKQDDGTNVYDGAEDVLSDEYRQPIPTGVFDDITGGGIGRGEVFFGIAPLGTGKSTLSTFIANKAHNAGYKVVQIIFEDKPKEIKRKHYACWSGIPIDELNKNKELVLKKAEQHKKANGSLIIKKFSPYGTTMSKVHNFLRKLKNSGQQIDMVILDYLDCVAGENGSSDYTEEGVIMRHFEHMVEDLNVAGLTFSQGNRQSINAEVVTVEEMGGSIKKAQFGHFVFSIAKSLSQKENGKANIGILKSRFGRDGMVYENITFRNDIVFINLNDSGEELTFMGVQENKKQKVSNVLKQHFNKKEKEQEENYDQI